MLSGGAKFKCSNRECSEIIELNSNDFDFQNTWTDEDRGMGSEEGYEGEAQVVCPNCNEEYEVSYEYTEYPIGAPNFEEGPKFNKNVDILENTLTIF
ncbi:hypothetical protein [Candidatus Enterococcus mansonii]|uniref:Uncharacterized protein n=1 Tax=Candidatus Enterococcus mansonii TaxID=1834181 RepID=A0A242CH94_9ENTE|nr:hypothetical protein [Enterococcus sp. 4G2_DIV0659]OTO09613.1 hypothetical protein A5880_000292 [Enterococcus sp. 4G2_DIV0659]